MYEHEYEHEWVPGGIHEVGREAGYQYEAGRTERKHRYEAGMSTTKGRKDEGAGQGTMQDALFHSPINRHMTPHPDRTAIPPSGAIAENEIPTKNARRQSYAGVSVSVLCLQI